jgi:hypothetical protein
VKTGNKLLNKLLLSHIRICKNATVSEDAQNFVQETDGAEAQIL